MYASVCQSSVQEDAVAVAQLNASRQPFHIIIVDASGDTNAAGLLNFSCSEVTTANFLPSDSPRVSHVTFSNS